MENKNKLKRTHTCGELREKDLGKNVVLCGWAESIRLHGGMVFVNLFDRYGTTQLVFSREAIGSKFDEIKSITPHTTLCVSGLVRNRPEEAINKEMPTGSIEVDVEDYVINNIAKPLPIPIGKGIPVYDDVKLKWMPIYLRERKAQQNLILRSKVFNIIMQYFHEHDFIYVETPILAKPTPEGARDFLVPSRIHNGKFYALPQSPQQYKQKLMIAGLDKYYQIAKCFRDEDLRADRQPEFTQLDIEMSWPEPEDIFEIIEGMFKRLFKEIIGIDLKTPFRRMNYEEAMELYGTDKPDLRNPLKISDVSKAFEKTEFSIFKDALKEKGVINAIKVSNNAERFTRKYIDSLATHSKSIKGSGIIVLKIKENNSAEGSIAKHLSEEEISELMKLTNASPNDILLLSAGKKSIVKKTLGSVRLKLGTDLNLVDKDRFELLWITEFPLFEFSETEHRWVYEHHPFTSPEEEYMPILMKLNSLDELKEILPEMLPSDIKSKAYDIVINGWEIGGGSIRIHKRELQEKIFELLGLSREEYLEKFGSLLELLEYGAPPHGGIALGLDRIAAILAKEESIREVIAFPKNKEAQCLMDDSPSEVSQEQLKELGISIINNQNKSK